MGRTVLPERLMSVADARRAVEIGATGIMVQIMAGVS